MTAIIPSRDRADDLRRCLSALSRQDWPNLEVIVVDDASSDHTHQMVLREFPGVELIRFREAVGAAMARNAALARARGRYVWFLDSDSEPLESDSLRRLVAALEADPTLGAVGGEMCRDRGGNIVCRIKHLRVNGETTTTEVPLVELTSPLDTDYLPTCNLLMRRDLAVQLGGFDPTYVVLSEDKEMCCRIRARGLRNAVVAAPVLHHISRRARRGDLLRKLRNTTRFAIINLPWWRVLLLPLLDMLCLLGRGKLRALRRGGVSVTKHLPAGSANLVARSRTPTLVKLLLVGPRYFAALLAAYAWNLGHIVGSLRMRWRRPNFVEEAGQLLKEKAEIHPAEPTDQALPLRPSHAPPAGPDAEGRP